MTSWMECGCGGDVTLYEHPGEEYYGRTWPILLTGNCKRCGMFHATVPGSLKAEFEKARIEYERDEIRRMREEEEQREEEYRQYLATLSPEELLKELGPESYPWFYVRIHDSPGRGGQVLTALTMERARIVGTAAAKKGQYITVEQDYKTLDEWRHGDRPELKKYYVHTEWDFTVHDTGEHEDAKRTINCGSLEDARRVAESEKRYWTNRPSNTYYRWSIIDEDGKLMEASA